MRVQSGAGLVLGWLSVVVGGIALMAVLFTQAPVVSAVWVTLLLLVVTAGSAYHAHVVRAIWREAQHDRSPEVIDVSPPAALPMSAGTNGPGSALIPVGRGKFVDDSDFAIRTLAFRIAGAMQGDPEWTPTRANVARTFGVTSHDLIAQALDHLRAVKQQEP